MRKEFKALLNTALKEDLNGNGDVTSRAIFKSQRSHAVLKSKQTGVLAGADFFRDVFRKIDANLIVDLIKNDGDSLNPGDIVARINGRTVSILEAERTAINFLSFLSGIATMTRQYVEISRKNGKSIILDTRKTLPGYRKLSKYAVTVGGGRNHRMGLYDMVLIKDNHIDAAGSITKAVEHVRKKWGDKFRIEVECRNLKDVDEALVLDVDIIMLDNMSEEDTSAAVKKGNGHVLFEASGNMDEEKITRFSRLGVDYISTGMITHSVKAFDFSLVME